MLWDTEVFETNENIGFGLLTKWVYSGTKQQEINSKHTSTIYLVSAIRLLTLIQASHSCVKTKPISG